MRRLYPSSSKQIWCFACNCMQNVCLHKECPQHCDMCARIKEIRSKASGYKRILYTKIESDWGWSNCRYVIISHSLKTPIELINKHRKSVGLGIEVNVSLLADPRNKIHQGWHFRSWISICHPMHSFAIFTANIMLNILVSTVSK